MRWEKAHPEKVAKKKKLWAENNKLLSRKRSRIQQLKQYNLSLEDYEQLLLNQDRKCLLCRSPNPKCGREHFCVDHCHTTGKVRGLLCFDCNTGIGKLQDNSLLLRRAADYIEGKI